MDRNRMHKSTTSAIFVLVTCFASALLAQKTETTARDSNAAAAEKSAPRKPVVRVTISKETTRITEPLREDGYPDYVRYLNDKLSEGVMPQNNAAVLLWRAFGPGEVSKEYRKEFFTALGIEALPESGSYFIDFESYYTKLRKAERDRPAVADEIAMDEVWKRQERAQEEPWTSRDDPDLAAWLKANEKPLSLLVESSKRERYFNPLIEAGDPPLIFALLPHINSARQAATTLAKRAMVRLGEGQPEAAWDDVMTIYRIARHVSSGPTLVEGLVSIAVEGIAGRVAARVIQLGKFNAEQLAQMQADLAKLPPAGKMRDKLNVSERFNLLDAVCGGARKGVGSLRALGELTADENRMPGFLDFVGNLLIDWNVPLRAGNEWFDRLDAVLDAPTKEKRNELLAKFDQDVHELRAKFKQRPSLRTTLFSPRQMVSEKVSIVVAAIWLPALTAVIQSEDRGATNLTLVELAIALERYRADDGRYPQNLADLAPKYVTKIPNDAFADRPLVYRTTEKGYLLYGLGKNGEDDGGVTYNDVNEADDVVVATPDATQKPEP